MDAEFVTQPTRRLGLVTGLGLAAGIHYYTALTKAVEAQGRKLDLTMLHGHVPTIYKFMERNDLEGLANHLLHFIERLQSSGAEVAAISAVMPHAAIGGVRERSPIPLVSILEVVADAIAAHGYRRVALFGARYSVESRLYGALPQEMVVPLDPRRAQRLYEIYRDVAEGNPDDIYIDELFAMGKEIIAQGDAEAIILAGTDLTSLFDGKIIPFPHVDAMREHVAAIVAAI